MAGSVVPVAERIEELHPDLALYLGESAVLGAVLKAPLVFLVPYQPALASFANEMYRTKLEGIRRAEAQRSWEKVVWLHEKPYRLPVFLSLCERLSDRDYWQALASLWLETENLHEHEGAWLGALTAGRPGRARWLMDTSDRDRLAGLSETLTVYRGFAPPGGYRAPSWSLSRSRAEWFAARSAGRARPSYLASTTVPKDRVIAYFGGRGEQEIVLDPATLVEARVTRIRAPSGARAPGALDGPS
jgi:hypothetical protein